MAAEGDVVKKQARIAAAVAQSGATIERTQTINLLRESMYRTCERYLSGAISKGTLVVQAARDQRAMVAVLAIEQLTRVARPPSTVLSPPATSASLPNQDLIEMVAAFRKERDAAQKAADSAKKDFDKADTTGKCSTVSDEPADDSGTPKKTDWNTCKTAQDSLKTKQTELVAAKGRLDQALALGGGSDTGGTIASSTGQGPQNDGGGGGTLSETAIAKIADTVKEIANFQAIDEVQMFCIGYLSDSISPPDSYMSDICKPILQARAAQDDNVRMKLLAGGSDIEIIDMPSPATDEAGVTLRAYLTQPASASERKRRMALAQKASSAIGLSAKAIDVSQFVMVGDRRQKVELLEALRAIETDAVGKAALKPAARGS